MADGAGSMNFHEIESRTIFVGMFLALILIVAMSVQSRFDSHPDEIWHANAGQYYTGNWLPPKVCQRDTLESYSRYGMSYLNAPDVVYFFSGKFNAIIGHFGVGEANSFLPFRYFNIALFLVLTMLSLRAKASLLFLPLLLTPQVWYIFSYFNGDALPLFLCFLIAYQVLAEGSRFNAFIRDPRGHWEGGLLLGVFVGLLCVSKLNYVTFLVFLSLYFVFEMVFYERNRNRSYLKCVLFVVVVAGAIFSFAQGVELIAHGFNKRAQVLECAEQTAKEGFRPSDHAAGKGFAWSYLRSKGVKYGDLFSKARWGELSFRSFAGLYGYMSIVGPSAYYRMMKVLYLLLLLLLLYSGFRNRDPSEMCLTGLVILMSGLTVLASSYHSWVSDFQAQGRYLFPVLPMYSFVLYKLIDVLPKSALAGLAFFLFAGSVYSFIWVGLLRIPATM